MNRTLTKARQLRQNPTEAEALLWQQLRNRQLDGHKFKRQFPIGHYACPTAKLIIELDGSHHSDPEQQAYDNARTQYLQARNYRILRFQNHHISTDLSTTLNTIRQLLLPPLARSAGVGVGG